MRKFHSPLLLAACFLILLITSPLRPQGEQVIHQPDTRQYFKIAELHPLEPCRSCGYQKDRFVAPAACGWIARTTGVRIERVFWLGAVVFSVLAVALLVLCLRRMGVDAQTSGSFAALLILNPYILRYHLSYSAMLPDLVFFTAVLGTLYGVLARRLWVVAAGFVLGMVARQNAALLIPASALSLLAAERRKAAVFLQSLGLSVVLLLALAGLCGFLTRGSLADYFGPVWESFCRAHTRYHGFFWDPVKTLQIYGYILYPNVPYLAILAAALIRREPSLIRRDRIWVKPFVFYAVLCVQYLAMTPRWMGKNSLRYSYLIAGPLIVLAGWFLSGVLSRLSEQDRQKTMGTLIVLALVGSFCHHTARIGGWAPSKPLFGFLFLFGSFLMFGVVAWARRRERQSRTL